MPATLVRIVLLASIVHAGGCANGTAEPAALQSSSAAAALEGTWVASALPGAAGPPRIELRDGEASGHTGCNAFGARYTLGADGGITFGPVTATKKLCMGAPMQSEARVLDALARTARVEVAGSTLQMHDGTGTVLLEWTRDD
jgi:heat shock protein HslJ